MSTENFLITEHAVPACHIREYPGSTVHQDDILQLHIKQYTPRHQSNPLSPSAVTIIAAHGVGLAKELYEPLWDEILLRAQQHNYQIRGIWIADVASMGMSGILNEDNLSTDCSWMDHPRDLLLMINRFRDEMPRPLVGLGHSFGGTIITNLAFLHPRLFTSLILLDPVIQLNPPTMGFGTDPPSAINWTLYRSDVWPTRQAAMQAYQKLFPATDARCLERVSQFGFRSLPTALHPELPGGSDPNDPPVTLTTTKYHDLVGQIRANFAARTPEGRIVIDRSTHADMDPLAAFIPMYRPEPRSTYYRLPTLRPSALFVLGEKSFLRLDEIREGIKACGRGVGGSGGIGEGRVREVTLPRAGHLFPFEEVAAAADAASGWLGQEMHRYTVTESDWNAQRQAMSQREHQMVGEQWTKTIRPPTMSRKPARKERL